MKLWKIVSFICVSCFVIAYIWVQRAKNSIRMIFDKKNHRYSQEEQQQYALSNGIKQVAVTTYNGSVTVKYHNAQEVHVIIKKTTNDASQNAFDTVELKHVYNAEKLLFCLSINHNLMYQFLIR